jgi:SHS2 domain-containing protein
MTTARHTFAEHTGELEIVLVAPSLGELFGEAARALAEVMAGELPAASGVAETVSVTARDRDALLVAWLNELLFLDERDKKIYFEVRIDRVNERALTATVRGAEVSSLRTQVKAATLHGLRIADGPEGVSATVIFDV